jgi:C4-type Zn-finger protein
MKNTSTMNWECNLCGYRVQPVKEVEPREGVRQSEKYFGEK